MATPIPFNASWYLSQNPDVAAAVEAGLTDAETHFQQFGRFEGRSPSFLLDVEYYLANNPDVAAAVQAGQTTAWDHALQNGIAEGRLLTRVFDETFYLQSNPDVAQAVANGSIASGLEHFVLFGHTELRAINPVLDLGKYLEANPDVADAAASGAINPLAHLMVHGITEGRSLGNGIQLPVFDNDPLFTGALSQNSHLDAWERVKLVAPFVPTFERPAGWTPPADTPLPVDFIPPTGSGIRLVVPSEVPVPGNVVLSDQVFVVGGQTSPTPTPAPRPTPAPSPVDDGPSVFTVSHSGEGVYVIGNQHGQVDVTIENNNYVFTPANGFPVTVPVGSVTKLVVNGVTLTGSALVLSGKSIEGTGTVAITNLQAKDNADLSLIKTTSVTATAAGDVAFRGDLGKAAVTVASGTMNVSDATLGTSTFSVASGATLEGTAAQLSGVSVSGGGTTVVTALKDSSAADLSTLLTTSVTADSTGNVTFTGDLGKAAVTVSSGTMNVDGATLGTATFNVASGATLAGTAAKLSGISVSGEGETVVSALQGNPSADLSTLLTASVTADSAGDVIFTGHLGKAVVTVTGGKMNVDGATLGTSSFNVASGATLEGTGAKLSGVTVSGDGTVLVTALQTDTDLSKITPATLNVTVTDSISLAGLDLSNVDHLTVAAAGVTASQAQLDALVGKVTVASGFEPGLTLDTTSPTATIAITAIADDTGSSTTDFVTSDTTLILSGTMMGKLAFGEKAQISVDGTHWIDLTVTDGGWSYTDSRTLTSGQYTYSVRTIDAAGNFGSLSTQTVTVDTPPTASSFIATATTVGATSTEAGSLGLYDGDGKVIGSFSTTMTANTPVTLGMTAQNSVTNATLKVADATSNFAADTQSVLLGTTGDDLLTGTDQIDYIYGFGANDTITGGGGDDTLTGGAGNDTFNVDVGSDTITDLASGDSLMVSAGATATANNVVEFVATNATNQNGSAVLNAVNTGAKIDVSLSTGSEGYVLKGGAETDILIGSSNNDQIFGGGGDDWLTGGTGNDTFNVDAGFDTITDLATGDILVVSSGATATANNMVAFVATNATVQNGSVVLKAADTGASIDVSLSTGSQGYALNGGVMADTLVGSSGDDTITGGYGADRINVGTGTDLVVLRNNDSGQNNSTGSSVSTVGFDIYTGLSAGDKVEIYRDVTYNNFGSVLLSTSDVTGVDEAIKFTRGTYTPGNNQFTAGASGNDTLVTYDLSTPTGGQPPEYEAIVLVGFVGHSNVGSTSSGRGATVTLIDF